MSKKKLTRERLRQIIREEKRKLTEVRDRGSFFVVVVRDQDGQLAFKKRGSLTTYDITDANQYDSRGAAEVAAEDSKGEAFVSEAQYRLSNI